MPQKDTLDNVAYIYLYAFLSYLRITPQFQFSLSAVTLDIYLDMSCPPSFPIGFPIEIVIPWVISVREPTCSMAGRAA